MKKVLVFLFSVLLIVGIFVSCDSNVQPKGTALVRFNGEVLLDKGLNANVDYEDDLVWYYRAKAQSEDFNYGDTGDAWTAVPETVELSLGTWDFELKAIKEPSTDENSNPNAEAIYAGSLEGFLVQPNDGVVSIAIPVIAQAGGDGYIVIGNDITIQQADGSTAEATPNNATIDGVAVKFGTTEACTGGVHTVKVWYVDPADNIVKAEETIIVSVFTGATTTVDGFISESVEEETESIFESVAVAVSEETITNEAVTSSISGETTVVKTTGDNDTVISNEALSVTIPVGTILVVEDGMTAGQVKSGLTVVDNAEAENNNLTIAAFDNSYVFDLTLNVSESNETLIKVEYQIGAGLDITGVYHKNAQLPNTSENGEYYEYNSTTGILTLYLYHASYITIVEGGAFEVSSEATLKTAVALGGDFIITNDIHVAESIVVPKDVAVNIDLNGKTISGSMTGSSNSVIKNNGTLNIENGGTVKCTGKNGGAVVIDNYGTMAIDSTILNGAPYEDGDTNDPSYVIKNSGNIAINNSTITSDYSTIYSYKSGTEGGKVTLNNCEVTMYGANEENKCHCFYTDDESIIEINGGTYTSTAVNQKSSIINGIVVVSDGVFTGKILNAHGDPVLNGGTYSVDPYPYVGAGKVAIYEDGVWTIKTAADLASI